MKNYVCDHDHTPKPLHNQRGKNIQIDAFLTLLYIIDSITFSNTSGTEASKMD